MRTDPPCPVALPPGVHAARIPARKPAARLGFTAIELVGTLAVISILVAVVTPGLFGAINEAKLMADVQSIATLKCAALTYAESYGRFAALNGATFSYTNNAYQPWDQLVLLREQLVEKPFSPKLGTKGYIRLTPVNTSSTADVISSGNRGTLGSILCNNGVYDLTQEYSALAPTAPQEPAYAFTSPRFGGPFARALASLVLANPPTGSSLPSLSPTPNPLDTNTDLPSRLAASCRTAAHWLSDHSAPFRQRPIVSCYPLPYPIPKGGGVGDGTTPPGGTYIHSSRPPANNDANVGKVVVEVIIEGMNIQDAFRLSMKIDGAAQSNWAYWDSCGRVKYDFVSSSTGPVFVFLANK